MTTTTPPKPKLIVPQTGFSALTHPEMLTQTNLIETNIVNPNYTNLPIDPATIKATNDAYAAAITAAADGSKTAKAALAKQRADVAAMLRVLGQYVENASQGDMTVFLSSGFLPVSKVKTPPQPLPPATIAGVNQGNTGQLLVTITKVTGSRIYEIHYATLTAGLPGPYTTVLASGAKTATTINGLTPGSTYTFQVRAYNKTGYSDWSDSVTKMCT
jgi:hypothetical protein